MVPFPSAFSCTPRLRRYPMAEISRRPALRRNNKAGLNTRDRKHGSHAPDLITSCNREPIESDDFFAFFCTIFDTV